MSSNIESGGVDARVKELLSEHRQLLEQLQRVEAETALLAPESWCGNTDDTQDVEDYDGSLGVSHAFVTRHEPPVGQLQWLDDLAQRFAGSGEDPGNVSGRRWGTGAMIDVDLYLTAGHCFDRFGGGWTRPSRDGEVISSFEIAKLMRVNFNYQKVHARDEIRPGVSFTVEELLEYRLGGVDYAIARLGRDAAGRLPGSVFGVLPVATADLHEQRAMLCVIQHPNGQPKRVGAGPMRDNDGFTISYDTIDTLGGSSGSPVLSPAGRVVGVHTNGGCTAISGFNHGAAIGAICRSSSII